MQAIRYRITALSPLLFASNTGDPNMVATLDYIPGSHLRGMFAQAYIKRCGLSNCAHEDDTFYRWFLRGEIKVTNAYIASEVKKKYYTYYPIPVSIQMEKGSKSIAYDLLFQDEDFGLQTKEIGGYGRVDGSICHTKTVRKSLNFHHARDRRRGVSKEGAIYNYESIDEGQVFEGFLIGSARDLKEFASTIQSGIYYLGRSRNSQYGKVRFDLLNTEPEEFTSELGIDLHPKGDEAVLTLLSDTVIYNKNGFSTVDLLAFQEAIGCKVKKAFLRRTEEEGFISVWRLKTPSEACFRAGSCFLLELKDGDLARLKGLQKTGLGMHTHLGLGRFTLGLQQDGGEIAIRSEEKQNLKRPTTEIPQETRQLIKGVIKEAIVKRLQINAIKDARDFKELPPKSLLAKLEALVEDRQLDRFLKEGIKATAMAHLEKCRTDDKTLFDYLTGFVITVEAIVNERQDLRGLCKEVSYSSADIEAEWGNELKKAYLVTLLSTMRKIQKQGGSNDV